MRSFSGSDDDRQRVAKMKAKPWMVRLLSLNPSYVHWGPHEDYMWKTDDGWEGRVFVESWSEFDWKLDDINECVHFYFQLHCDSKDCAACERGGYRRGTEDLCQKCDGEGSVFTSPARVQLILWMLHPRKGAARGVEIQRVERADLPAVMRWLAEAARRNAERFAKVVSLSGGSDA